MIAMQFIRFALCFSTLLCCVCFSLIATPPGSNHFVKTADGIVVFPDAAFSRQVKLQVIKDNIIRVLVSPFEIMEPANNLVTIYTGSPTNREEQESKDHIVLKTSRLVATIKVATSVGTGAVLFSDNTGNAIVKERPVNGYRFELENDATIICCKGNAIVINRKPLPKRSKRI
jgi:hypothetical protein